MHLLRRFRSISLGGAFAAFKRPDPRLLIWLPLVPILLFSILFRLGYLVAPHITGDWGYFFANWGAGVAKSGLFNYWPHGNRGYRYPLYMPVLGIYYYIQSWRGTSLLAIDDQSNYLLARLLPFFAELFLITLSYAWLRRERYFRWLIPLGLSIAPTIILIGSLSGELDICMMVFIALALIAMNRDKPGTAWAFFALGMLVKTQAVIVFPLLVVLTLRRYGWRSLIRGVAFGAVVGGTYLLPFVLGVGAETVLKGYYGAPGTWPFTQFA